MRQGHQGTRSLYLGRDHKTWRTLFMNEITYSSRIDLYHWCVNDSTASVTRSHSVRPLEVAPVQQVNLPTGGNSVMHTPKRLDVHIWAREALMLPMTQLCLVTTFKPPLIPCNQIKRTPERKPEIQDSTRHSHFQWPSCTWWEGCPSASWRYQRLREWRGQPRWLTCAEAPVCTSRASSEPGIMHTCIWYVQKLAWA